jgi:hypothetical protein
MSNSSPSQGGLPEVPPTATPSVPHAYSVQQITQFNTAIPAHVWTSEVLKDLHTRQERIALDTNASINGQRKREHVSNLVGLGIMAVIIFTGLIFMAEGVTGGKELILGTVAFVAGVAAGKGMK